jgi:hypothetical protein
VGTSTGEIARAVMDIIRQHWNDTHQAIPLTTLGSKAGSIPGYRQQQTLPLLQFLRTCLDAEVRLVRHPYKEGTWAAVPSDAPPDIPDVELFPAPSSARADTSKTRKTYDPKFWGVFAKPLSNGKRWLLLTKRGSDIVDFEFRDFPDDVEPPEGAIEVGPDFIVGGDIPSGPDRSSIVYGNIQRWFSTHGVPETPFLLRPPLDLVPRTHYSEPAHRMGVSAAPLQSSGSSALSRLKQLSAGLELIDRSDQARIMVPLDIISKLLDRLH